MRTIWIIAALFSSVLSGLLMNAQIVSAEVQLAQVAVMADAACDSSMVIAQALCTPQNCRGQCLPCGGNMVCVATNGKDWKIFVFILVKLASYARAYPPRKTSLLPPVTKPITPLSLACGFQLKPILGIQLFVSVLGSGSNLNAGS